MDEQTHQMLSRIIDGITITHEAMAKLNQKTDNLVKAHDQDVTSRLERLEEKLDGILEAQLAWVEIVKKSAIATIKGD